MPISYYVGGEYIKYDIRLDTTPYNYGGKRYWFLCPVCGKRVGKLYLLPEGRYFACRACNNLTYRSSKEHDARVDAMIKNPFLASAKVRERNLTHARLVLKAYFKMRGRRFLRKYS